MLALAFTVLQAQAAAPPASLPPRTATVPSVAAPALPGLAPLEEPVAPAFPGQYASRPAPNFAPAPKRCMQVLAPELVCPCLDWLSQDFSALRRHAPANASLAPPRPGERRVIFFGDSITDHWSRPGFGPFFPGKPYINRGIGSQTTMQMLARFRSDVIAHAPKVVVILAGTNDIAGSTGFTSQAQTGRNLGALVDLARFHRIRVVLASLLPVRTTPVLPAVATAPVPGATATVAAPPQKLPPAPSIERPPQRIVAMNQWLAQFARTNGLTFLDYHAAMVDTDGQIKLPLTDDGVHPSPAGYAVMAPLAEKAIDLALRRPLPSRPLVFPPPVTDGLDLRPTGPVPQAPVPATPAGDFPGQRVAATLDDPKLPWSPRACTTLPDLAERCRCLAHRLFNFAGLDRYAAANAVVRPGERHVIFMGDSVIEDWGAADAGAFFPGKPYLNRGIAEQTTEQMLARFPQDVLALGPTAVVILGGSNDLAGNTGKRTLEETAGNLASMAELALMNGSKPILVSLLPVSDATIDPKTNLPRIRTGGMPPSLVQALNHLIAAHARRLRVPFVDAYAALANAAGHLQRDYTRDGIRLTAAGYAALGRALEPALRVSVR